MLPLANEPFSFILFVTPATASSERVFTTFIDPVQNGTELLIELDVPNRAKHTESGDLEARLTVLRGVAQAPDGAYRESFSWDVLPAESASEASADQASVVKAALQEAAASDPVTRWPFSRSRPASEAIAVPQMPLR